MRDASVGDGGVDAASDAAVDAAGCMIRGQFAGDDFTGIAIDAQKWTLTSSGVAFTQNDQLEITIPAGTAAGAFRAIPLIAPEDDVLLEIARAPYVAGTKIALSLEGDLNEQLYRFEIDASGTATLTALGQGGSSFSYSGSEHRFIGLRHEGPEIVFVTSPDGSTIVPKFKTLATMAAGYRIVIYASGASPGMASTSLVDNLRVTCR